MTGAQRRKQSGTKYMIAEAIQADDCDAVVGHAHAASSDSFSLQFNISQLPRAL
jgi:molybdate-binding protein